MIPRGRLFTWSVVALLAVNLLFSFMTGRPEERERVPYQPFFVDQVEAATSRRSALGRTPSRGS
jgi:hypothetical protein